MYKKISDKKANKIINVIIKKIKLTPFELNIAIATNKL